MTAQTQEFKPFWQDFDPRFVRPELPPAPQLPLYDVLGPAWARWIKQAAEAKAAPPDYIMLALLAVAGATIGNTRWASPWDGWAEPPIIWAMAIGNPSMNKTPGLDAVLSPLRKLEREARKRCEGEVADWKDRAEIAKLAEGMWKEAAKAAIKDGKDVPAKPGAADPGPAPVSPRYALTDTTVERLGVILAGQPRGALLFRDELSGWLQGMTRYSGGGSDRPFWLEAYNGKGFSVERMGRDPVYVDSLSVGVLGGIQPDKLKSLLFKTDDDGLLARFMPVWPNPAPIKRPTKGCDDAFLTTAFERLIALQMPTSEDGSLRPWFVPFDEDAATLFQTYRETVRAWEQGVEGLLLSFTGKLPGLAVRLSLILAYLDYAASGDMPPGTISSSHFMRAALLIESYIMPMARRSYSEASVPKEERAARRLVSIIQENRLTSFTTREIMQMEKAGLSTKADLDPALSVLEEASIIRRVEDPKAAKGGAPRRLYAVHPLIGGKV